MWLLSTCKPSLFIKITPFLKKLFLHFPGFMLFMSCLQFFSVSSKWAFAAQLYPRSWIGLLWEKEL